MSKQSFIPLVDLTKEYQFFKKKIDATVKNCFQRQQWILGDDVADFEQSFARYLGISNVIGLASGTDALILALRALAWQKRKKAYFDSTDEIITTPFSFIASPESILRVGARPVFVDIDPDTFTIDPASLKKAITKKTVGIVPVHLYGLACDMKKIVSIAKHNGLFVVEDAAQSAGAEYNGRKLGTWGDAAAFSFFPSKNLGACGDAGAVSTRNRKLADTIRLLRNHGQAKVYDASFIGYNSRLDALQAALLSVKLPYLDKLNAKRRSIAGLYNTIFKDSSCITSPFEPKGSKHVYHLYTIKVKKRRNQLVQRLNSRNIGARCYYPVALHQMKAFQRAKVQGQLSGLGEVLRTVLSLPIHPFLKDRDVRFVAESVREFFHGA